MPQEMTRGGFTTLSKEAGWKLESARRGESYSYLVLVPIQIMYNAPFNLMQRYEYLVILFGEREALTNPQTGSVIIRPHCA